MNSLWPTLHSILSAFKKCPLVWLTAAIYRAPDCWWLLTKFLFFFFESILSVGLDALYVWYKKCLIGELQKFLNFSLAYGFEIHSQYSWLTLALIWRNGIYILEFFQHKIKITINPFPCLHILFCTYESYTILIQII